MSTKGDKILLASGPINPGASKSSRPELSFSTRQALLKNMSMEYELYEYLNARLTRQLATL